MDRLQAMRVLLAAVDSGSLSGAARALQMPLPTVSRKVAELERALGTRLVSRGSRRLSLTEAGSGYVASARRILEQVAEAERTASGEYVAPMGDLVISAPHVLGRTHVLPVVFDFLNAYGNVRVRLQQTDRSVHLIDERVDIAVRLGEPRDGSLVALPVGTVRRLLCASARYLEQRGTPRSVADLARHDCVVYEEMGSTGRWDFASGWLDYAGPTRSRIVVNSAEASLSAALAGFGVAHLLSYQTGDALASGALRTVLDALSPPPLPVSLLYAAHRPLPLKVRAFIDFAAPRLRAALAH